MKVYLDTGVFFDYLIKRSHAGIKIRKGSRRGRSRNKLFNDANSFFHKLLSKKHDALTSTLTLFELEHAVYEELASSKESKNVSFKIPFLVISARAAITQGLTAIQIYKINLIELTEQIISNMLTQLHLQSSGILAADSLHITSAILNDVEIVVSTDKHMLNLDNKLKNKAGNNIRIVDTDVALNLL